LADDVSELELACLAHRQRLLAAAATLLASEPGMQGPCGPNRTPGSFDWNEHVKNMTESEFKLRYRVGTLSFQRLLHILEPTLAIQNERQALNSRSGKPVELPTRLAVALRYFAGGDPLDLYLIYCITKSTVMECVWRTVDAIHAHLNNMNFPIDDVDQLRDIEAGFRSATRGGFWEGQVGAIDGVHFKMQAPGPKDVEDPMRYHVARKDIYALLAIAICDADRRFLYADISFAPQTHDSTAWGSSELGIRVQNGDLPYPFFLNGDAAFALGPSMITPSNNDPALDAFDFWQSSNRMAIECAFGILVRRWGVLWRPLRQKFARRAPLIGALMRLHNFCIDERLGNLCSDDMPDVHAPLAEVQPGRCRRPPKFDKDGRPVDHLDTYQPRQDGAPVRISKSVLASRSARRNELAKAVSDSGYTRVMPMDLARKRKRPKGRAPA
jgi:hypothetical protein